mgnify:FL=1|tara:strand:- start:25 stop:216 length:192 start_codon:yes stop_codon:yes gene_type:complete
MDILIKNRDITLNYIEIFKKKQKTWSEDKEKEEIETKKLIKKYQDEINIKDYKNKLAWSYQNI